MSVRHKKWYLADGSTVISVTNEERDSEVLYRLHISVLRNRSSILNDVFSLPAANDAAHMSSQKVGGVPLDGSDDDHPFRLPSPNVTPSKFDHLVTYLYCGPTDYPQTDQFLFDVLELSSYLDISDGVNYVVNTLNHRPFFCPVLRFRLARTYSILDWIEPAVRQLLEWDTIAFELQHVQDIGDAAFYHIMIAKAKIHRLRVGMAFKCPPLERDPACRRSCDAAWQREWWNGLAKYILHPGWTMTGFMIKHQLDVTEIGGVCDRCQKLTIQLMSDRGIFTNDQEILEEAIKEIKRIHGDLTPSQFSQAPQDDDY